ncbi:MAG TPA: 2-phospho-L-lactate guanylyltransferase, partial [Burkholderiales bacterium]|nr:2-phospho-L-lactate guanylyltransferase [Burkholderiales bacterium]
VPVKSFARAKQRLGGLLSCEEREALAHAMLKDVLSALADAPSLAEIAVITGDAEANAMARAAGARVIADTDDAGETAAVTLAAQRLSVTGHQGIVIVPTDVPLITSADIEALAAAHRPAPSLTLVPATGDGGTNALVCSPPQLIPFAFGEDSFRKHGDAARARGIDPVILHLERLGCDIDRPEDVASFLLRASATHTYRYLSAIKVPERLRFAREKAGDILRAEQLH